MFNPVAGETPPYWRCLDTHKGQWLLRIAACLCLRKAMCAVDSRGGEAMLLRPFGAQKVVLQMSAQCRTLSCSYC